MNACSATDDFTCLASVCAHALGAYLIGAALGVNRSTCIMSVLFAYRLLFAIGVDEIGEVVTCSTFASITLFVDAVSAFPTRYFCAIVRMRAAVIQVVGFASTSEEMLCIAAFGFRLVKLCTFAYFGIAR